MTASGTATPPRRFTTPAAMHHHMASRAGSEPHTWPSASPNGGPSRAVPSLHATATSTSQACLVYALTFAGSHAEAMVAANGLIEAAETSRNPCMLSFALCAFSFALREADPFRALDACRRGLVIAQDSGNRFNESSLSIPLASLEAEHGDTASAFDHVALSIRNYYDSGNTASMRSPLAILAALFDRLGRNEPAATIAGFALSPSPHSRPPNSTPRSPTSATSSATRSTNHWPARVTR